jgi:hypothetical protein
MKNTFQSNEYAGFASKLRSIPYASEVFYLTRLVLILLAIALPVTVFADSGRTVQNSGGNLAQASVASLNSVPAKANASRLKSNGGVAQLTAPASIPEPGTLCLLGAGLVGLASFMRRKFRAKGSLAGNLAESSGD